MRKLLPKQRHAVYLRRSSGGQTAGPQFSKRDDGRFLPGHFGLIKLPKSLLQPSQGGVNVTGGLDLTLRNGAPLVEGRVASRGGYQAVDMAVVKRFRRTCVPVNKKPSLPSLPIPSPLRDLPGNGPSERGHHTSRSWRVEPMFKEEIFEIVQPLLERELTPEERRFLIFIHQEAKPPGSYVWPCFCFLGDSAHICNKGGKTFRFCSCSRCMHAISVEHVVQSPGRAEQRKLGATQTQRIRDYTRRTPARLAARRHGDLSAHRRQSGLQPSSHRRPVDRHRRSLIYLQRPRPDSPRH